MKRLFVLLLTGTCILYGAGATQAWHVSGKVLCDDANKTPLAGVTVEVENIGQTVTGATGSYYLKLPDVDATYSESLIEGLPPDAQFVDPTSNELTLDINSNTSCGQKSFDWLINSSICGEQGCWLTGGGVKFSPITNTKLAEFAEGNGHGPIHNFGGNVNPGCSPVAGEGGQWNHIAHGEKLHFQGTAIAVVRCGNLLDITPGSESPVTPFNFIEFEGTGTLKGIKGNKEDFGPVYFFARAEDHNEPGNEKANGDNGGSTVDHYFLHVYANPSDPAGSTLLLVDVDGVPTTRDPITITGGNLQLHISSCDNPPAF